VELLKSGSLEVLYFCQSNRKSLAAPSWVPDFSQPILRPMGLDARFSAAGKTRPSVTVHTYTESGGDRCLTMTVFRLCAVDATAPQLGAWWRARRGVDPNLAEPEDVSRARIQRYMHPITGGGMASMLEDDNCNMHAMQQAMVDAELNSSDRQDQAHFRSWLGEAERALWGGSFGNARAAPAVGVEDLWRTLIADDMAAIGSPFSAESAESSPQLALPPELKKEMADMRARTQTKYGEDMAGASGLPLDSSLYRQMHEELLRPYAMPHDKSASTVYKTAFGNIRNERAHLLEPELLLMKQIELHSNGRRAFRAGSYVGLGPEDVEPGDLVVIPLGSRVPFIARNVEGTTTAGYQLIGEAFVQGVMKGEILRTLPEKERLRFV
jgi:hypothetical protein